MSEWIKLVPEDLLRGNQLADGRVVLDMRVLAHTYPPLRRWWSFCWWRLPLVRYLPRLLFGKTRSPYRQLVAIVGPPPAPTPLHQQRPEEFRRGGDHENPEPEDRVAASALLHREKDHE